MKNNTTLFSLFGKALRIGGALRYFSLRYVFSPLVIQTQLKNIQ